MKSAEIQGNDYMKQFFSRNSTQFFVSISY